MTSAGTPKRQTRLHKPDKNNDHCVSLSWFSQVFTVLSSEPYHGSETLVLASGCFSSCVFFLGPSDVLLDSLCQYFG